MGFLVLFCGIVGNGFLLVVLGTQRSMWQVHNVFIANLALADLVVVCTGPPFVTMDFVLGYYPVANDFHCQVNGFVVCLSYSVSVLSLVSISFNRYMKVCHSQLFLRLFSLKKSIAACGLLWLAALILNIPLLAGKPPYGYDKGSHHCSARSQARSLDYGTLAMSTHLVFPTFAIAFFNIAIFRHWRQSTKRLQTNRPDNVTKSGATQKAFSKSAHARNEKQTNLGNIQGTSLQSIDNENLYAQHTIPEIKVDFSESSTSSQLDLVQFASSASPKGSLLVLLHKKALGGKRDESGKSATDNVGGQKKKSPISRSEMALIRSLLVIAICLLLLYTPFAFCIFIDYFVPVQTEVMATASMLLFVNCSINWIIYGAMNTSFRKAYKLTLLVCCPWQQKQTLAQPESSCSKDNNLTDTSFTVTSQSQVAQTSVSQSSIQ